MTLRRPCGSLPTWRSGATGESLVLHERNAMELYDLPTGRVPLAFAGPLLARRLLLLRL